MKNAWNMVNSMITSWILNVIDSKLHTSVAYEDIARKMWLNIQKRYSVINVPRIHQLKAEIACCKQGNMAVVEFYSKLMGLRSELANYIKIPNTTCKCTCGKCSCDTYRTIIKMMEDDKTHQLLMSLDDDLFSSLRGQIVALEPVPPLDKIFNMVQQEENHKRMMRNRENRDKNAAAFTVSHRGKMASQTTRVTRVWKG